VNNNTVKHFLISSFLLLLLLLLLYHSHRTCTLYSDGGTKIFCVALCYTATFRNIFLSSTTFLAIYFPLALISSFTNQKTNRTQKKRRARVELSRVESSRLGRIFIVIFIFIFVVDGCKIVFLTT
jgi:predicted membrane protein